MRCILRVRITDIGDVKMIGQKIQLKFPTKIGYVIVNHGRKDRFEDSRPKQKSSHKDVLRNLRVPSLKLTVRT